MGAGAGRTIVVDDAPAPIAVLDTSVLVPVWSRLVLHRLAALPLPRFQPVWSEWIIAETWRVLTRRWLIDHDPDQDEALARVANRMLRHLLREMRLVSVRDYVGPGPWPGLKDEDDEPIWATAVAAGAQYVVSHNVEDFPPAIRGCHTHAGIEYLTAVEFIEDVLGEEASAVYGGPLPQRGLVRSRRMP